jgi:DNA repair exonuclease SbcCD ATPase subunit
MPKVEPLDMPTVRPVVSVAPMVTVHPIAPRVLQSTTIGNRAMAGDSDGEEFTIVSGNSAVSVSSNGFSISTDDNSAAANSLRRNFSGDFIWFIHDGKAYIIRDPATIRQAMDFFAPARELGRQQEELGKQQEALGAQQEALGAKQEALGEQMEKVRVKIPDMTAELQKLEAELKKMSEGGTQEDLGRLQEKIGAIQNRIGELQEKAGEQQSELGEKQGALGEEQGELGEQQGKLGEQQGKLGEQQDAASRKATREMKKLLDQAVASGLAKPA